MRLWRIHQATIGVVKGRYVAGGLDLAGVLDIAFTAEDATFSQPEARTMGEIQVFGMWPIHLGMRKTKEWLFTGDSMSGVEAAELGLANWAVPADEVESVAMADFEHTQRASGVRKAVQDRGEPFSHHRSYWNAYLASKRGGG